MMVYAYVHGIKQFRENELSIQKKCFQASSSVFVWNTVVLYCSALQFIFFERCLESRMSLLSSAMAMGF